MVSIRLEGQGVVYGFVNFVNGVKRISGSPRRCCGAIDVVRMPTKRILDGRYFTETLPEEGKSMQLMRNLNGMAVRTEWAVETRDGRYLSVKRAG